VPTSMVGEKKVVSGNGNSEVITFKKLFDEDV